MIYIKNINIKYLIYYKSLGIKIFIIGWGEI